MSCLQLTLICIVLQSNIALIFSAPISDSKSQNHVIGDKEFKVTSNVKVDLGNNEDNSSNARNVLKNHQIQVGDDSSMHIKIDISLTPEMFTNSAQSKVINPATLPQRTEEDLMEEDELSETESEGSQPLNEIKQDQQSNASKNKERSNDIGAQKVLVGGVTKSVGKNTEERADVKSSILINGEKPEKNAAGELTGGLKIEPKSINDETRQLKSEGSLGEKGKVDQMEDEDGEDMEDDETSAELESEEAEAEDNTPDNKESKNGKNDEVEKKGEDGGSGDQDDGEGDEDVEEIGDEEEEE